MKLSKEKKPLSRPSSVSLHDWPNFPLLAIAELEAAAAVL
jgi:hypothetical protein